MENGKVSHPVKKLKQMQTFKSITIPQPCRQSWQQMIPVIHGRHCENCCKTVTDFTKMTNTQIISYLSRNDNVCGRFETYQLNSINSQLIVNNNSFIRIFKRGTIALGLLWSAISFKAAAQTCTPTVQTASDRTKADKPAMIGKIYIPQYREIEGHVTDDNDTLPILGASIVTENHISTATDTNGNFRIRVPVTATTITVSFIGCITQKIFIAPGKVNYAIKIKEQTEVLGDIVIFKKPPFLKRIYYRFIKKPLRGIFHS